MFLSELDGGIHDVDQYVRKLSGTYIYVNTAAYENPQVAFVQAIDNRNAILNIVKPHKLTTTLKLEEVDVIAFKPEPGLINLETRPALLTHTFERQWQIGTSDHTVSARFITDERATIHSIIQHAFDSKYYTFREAFTMLSKDEKRHVALNKSFSLKKAKNRIVLLFMFKPVLSFTAGFSFAEPSQDSLTYCYPQIKEWTEEYEHIWKEFRL